MLAMRGGPHQVATAPGVKMGRPPPVPPRPDKHLVADALAKSRKVPAPVLPPGLKKDFQAPEKPPSPVVEKQPSPKLNGLSRVKSFIRDVIEKKSSSSSPQAKDSSSESALKNGSAKSQIPIVSQQNAKNGKGFNYPTEESVKNHSSQSVVRSLCSVLMNSSDKPKSPQADDKVSKIVKSNSFAEKPVPVRRAPPPPISPKPSKRVIEERLGQRSQNVQYENYSLRKLSASCEELNSTARPVVYQSPTLNKSCSPVLPKRPPNLPPGKPVSIFKRKSQSNSPIGNGLSLDPFPDSKRETPESFGDLSTECATEMLISEIIAAKNDALLTQMNGKTEISVNEDAESNNSIEKVANVSCKNDSVSVCSSDGSSGGSKTILFINSESCNGDAASNNAKNEERSKNLNDISNHELLIYELQKMKREADEERVTKRQKTPSASDAEEQNIQRSDWVVVNDNGNKVTYSSCQIVIDDAANPVDDSGICLNDETNFCDSSPCLSPSLISRLKEQFHANQKMSSLQGLPPLPKSLSGFNVVGGESVEAQQQQQPGPTPPPVPARGPTSLRYSNATAGGSPGSPMTPVSAGLPSLNGGSTSSSSNEMQRHHQRKTTTLDSQLALLKREMLSLRQLDLSLLSQLWSLNESIHEFRQYMNDRSNTQGVPEDDDDMEDEGDDSSSGAEDTTHSHSHSHRGRTPV